MSKIMKPQTLRHSRKELAIPGKLTNQEGYGLGPAPVNSHIKESLSKAHEEQSTKYMIIQISEELARQAEQKKPVAKAEAARTMFMKYRASK